MRPAGFRTDLSIYGRAIVMLTRRPTILVAPLLGAVVALVLSEFSTYLTNPIGGIGGGMFDFIGNVFYSFAFAVAIIQADEIQRGVRGTFDSAWEEARRKAAGIILAAIGFWFLVSIAQYAGSIFGLTAELALMLASAFFLIYTVPAAAIGGLPGQLAIGGSIRAVRADVFGTAILAIAFVVLFVLVPPFIVSYAAAELNFGHLVAVNLQALLRVIALGYLAFPFAKQYADVAFRI